MNETFQTWLDELAALAESDLAAQNQIRDEALAQSRDLIRLCSNAIRAGHRDAWDEAETLLAEADRVGQEMQTLLAPYPELVYAGYTQDALKELVEARVTLALISNRALPSVENAGIPLNTYLNGVCEAASELRRRCLDMLRHEKSDEAERLLAAMDAAYEVLMSFSYPDVITRGLRHKVDQLRGVLERTRGDLTNNLQMERLLKALKAVQP
ncbi:MAG: haloacid dehalogenase [Anaerolineae bacterium]|jgi:translin|nr:haloacid dehalogenase [Anaerolineae bacterium]